MMGRFGDSVIGFAFMKEIVRVLERFVHRKNDKSVCAGRADGEGENYLRQMPVARLHFGLARGRQIGKIIREAFAQRQTRAMQTHFDRLLGNAQRVGGFDGGEAL